MKEKKVASCQDLRKKKQEFLDKILENCYIDDLTGRFYCKRCKNFVHIDWYRDLAFCKVHIISRFGITYIEELYNIHVGGELDKKTLI